MFAVVREDVRCRPKMLVAGLNVPTGVPGRSTWFYKIRPEGIRVEEEHVADPVIVLFKEEL